MANEKALAFGNEVWVIRLQMGNSERSFVRVRDLAPFVSA